MARLIQAKGTPKEISYSRYLKLHQKKMLADGGNIPMNSAKLLELESKELKLFRTIKPCGRNPFKNHNNSMHMAMLIQAKGIPKELSYFQDPKTQQKKLLADGSNIPVNSAMLLNIESKEFKLFRTIKLCGGNPFEKNEGFVDVKVGLPMTQKT